MVVAMNDTINVAVIGEHDRMGWEVLWKGYQSHLGTILPDSAIEETWGKIITPEVPLVGLVAFVNQYQMAGLAHLSFSPSSWSRGDMCQIQDLFVAEHMRGCGAGHALMDEAFRQADKRRCSQVFWHLGRADIRAKMLMDKFNVGPEGLSVQVRRKLTRMA